MQEFIEAMKEFDPSHSSIIEAEKKASELAELEAQQREDANRFKSSQEHDRKGLFYFIIILL